MGLTSRKFLLAIVMVSFSGLGVFADPIEGMWKRPAKKGGTLEQIAACGNAFCVTVRSGRFDGQAAGKFTKDGNQYIGEITDLAKKKTYSGSLAMRGANRLKMSGCVMKVLCSSEIWTRQ
ncbi:MAG: DUF2147 domain-containing protein [Hyphomicrobiales bacterium]|nr:DUF2147 domain-containing protein [Hyphomicrobiales bacterium]